MKNSNRRRFLQQAGVIAGLAMESKLLLPAVAAAQAADPTADELNSVKSVLYGERSPYVTTTRLLEGSLMPEGGGTPRPNPYRPGAKTPHQDLTGIITPSSLHYTTQHLYGIPDINPATHRLLVHGLVDRELFFTMADLKRFPSVSEVHFVECIGNRPNPQGRTAADTHGRMANSEWTGVRLSVLLKETGLKPEGKWVVAEGLDGGKDGKSFPIAKALDDVYVAYGQNGEPIRPDNGFPLRLIVPGMEGIYNVKWLRRLKITDQPYLVFQENSRFLHGPKTEANMYEFGPKSLITYPSGSQKLSGPGYYAITGLAWSGAGKVKKVEVSADGGKTYREAEFVGPVLSRACARFCLNWKWDGQEAVLQSRCIDEKDQVQPTEEEAAKYWGYTREQLYLASNTTLGHCNWIQAWKVNPSGDVTNGLKPVYVPINDEMHDMPGMAGMAGGSSGF